MGSEIVILILVIVFVSALSFIAGRMMAKAKVPEMCHEECKRIKSMEQKFDILESDNRSVINERNKLASQFANQLNSHD